MKLRYKIILPIIIPIAVFSLYLALSPERKVLSFYKTFFQKKVFVFNDFEIKLPDKWVVLADNSYELSFFLIDNPKEIVFFRNDAKFQEEVDNIIQRFLSKNVGNDLRTTKEISVDGKRFKGICFRGKFEDMPIAEFYYAPQYNIGIGFLGLNKNRKYFLELLNDIEITK